MCVLYLSTVAVLKLTVRFYAIASATCADSCSSVVLHLLGIVNEFLSVVVVYVINF